MDELVERETLKMAEAGSYAKLSSAQLAARVQRGNHHSRQEPKQAIAMTSRCRKTDTRD